jgi:hypothetical protein
VVAQSNSTASLGGRWIGEQLWPLSPTASSGIKHGPPMTLGNVRLGVRGLHGLPPEKCPSYWSIVVIEDSKSPKPPPSPIGEYDDVTVGAVRAGAPGMC